MQNTSMRGALARAILLVAMPLLGMVMPAHADIGVAMDTGRIAVSQRLVKGGRYQLPTIGVRNPGSEPSTYAMGVGYLQGQPQRAPQENWFTFVPPRFTLQPGATQPVRITLEVPTGADPDDYAALVQAQIAPAGDGAQVGAAAAAQLTFTVDPSTLLEAWLVRARRLMRDAAPWSYLLPPLVALALASSWLRRAVSIDLRVVRRR